MKPQRSVFSSILFICTGITFWSQRGCEGLRSPSPPPSRRKWFGQAVAVVAPTIITTIASPSFAVVDELPLALRDYTKLAPLGGKTSSSSSSSSRLEGKTTNLSLQELASRLEEDLQSGHTGRGGYFISGDLDESIFDNDCVFVDPTNRVSSLQQYKNALRILFDPNQSVVEVVGTTTDGLRSSSRLMTIDEENHTIQTTIRSRGVLQLPWQPYITAYESNIIYRINKETGLIVEQSQTWSKSASRALQESFTPGLFRPAPQSTIQLVPASSTSSDSSSNNSNDDNKDRFEPAVVTKLFHCVNGRRPYEYSESERSEIDSLINQIASTTTSSPFQPERLLPGKWMLVYLQPGPTGIGIDRRIPFFPEFDFNDNFQIFTRDSVLNIGQVLGPLLQVSVQGDLMRVFDDNNDDNSNNGEGTNLPRGSRSSKRFVAKINSGKICWQQDQACFNLPISGEGLFDSVYLGERLRIGQNLNGGGARVVQVRLEP